MRIKKRLVWRLYYYLQIDRFIDPLFYLFRYLSIKGLTQLQYQISVCSIEINIPPRRNSNESFIMKPQRFIVIEPSG